MSEKDKQHFAKYQAHFSGVLKDGHTMFIDDVVTDLNRKSFLESEVIELRRENAELENEKTTLLKCHYNVCWELVELEKALYDSTAILGGKIQELEKENEWLFDFALEYTNSTFINESLQALKESK